MCFVEGVDDLAEADVDLEECVTTGCIGEEAFFNGDANLAVNIAKLILGGSRGYIKLPEQ